jgi:hypothetical protein
MAMKSKVIDDIATGLFGAKPEPKPLPARATRCLDIWEMSEKHKSASRVFLAAKTARNAAWESYEAAAKAEQMAYANLADIEVELQLLEESSGLKDVTVYHTVGKDNADDENWEGA